MINASPERHKFVNGAKLIKVGISCVTAVPVALVNKDYYCGTAAPTKCGSEAATAQCHSGTIPLPKNQLKFC